jgi:cyclohexa-1,5-dienecarbonyl-CoA hydratase
MEYKNIIVEEKEGIGRITLNRPPLNILNIEMMKEINNALKSFHGENLKALVLNSKCKAFSAGVDISDHTQEKVGEMIEVFHEIFSNMLAIKAPIVALVNGAALGGGCEVATFCDIVIASEKSKFGQPEVMVGVFPPIAAAIFPRIIGHKKGLELLLTGATILAPEAKEIGLVNHVLPVESFEEVSEKFLKESLADKSAVVLQLTKRAFIEGAKGPYTEAIKVIEKIYLDELMKTKDANEGLTAFLEKRKPVWKNE